VLPSGYQELTGTTDSDVLNGSDGADLLIGGPLTPYGIGEDTLSGGSGNDLLVAFNALANGSLTLNDYTTCLFDGGPGTDYLVVSGPVVFYGEIKSIEGIDLDPSWSGSYSSSKLQVNADFISQMPVNTYFRGSGDIDFLMNKTLVAFRTPGGYTIDYIASKSINTFDGSHYVFEAGSSIHIEIDGTEGSDTITGTSNGDYIDGGPGVPGDGANSLFGGGGDDTIVGGDGGNTLFGGDGNDFIHGGFGFNRVNGNVGDDTIIGVSTSGDWLSGGQGNDMINVSNPGTYIFVNGVQKPATSTGNNIINGNLGNDTIFGGAGADSLRGGQGDDVIHAGSGSDWITGDLGSNTIYGGQGPDTFWVSAGHDIVNGWHAGDQVQIASGLTYTVTQVNADVRVNLSNGGEIDLIGVQKSSLPSGWIVNA
jgi:Ca2+-binding RTX toxin-like protein